MVVGPNYGQKNGVWLEQPILTAGKVLKAGADNLPIDATNTDTDVADAVTKKHSNTLDHDGTVQDTVIGTKTTLTAVKADADIADAITKKHANTLDHTSFKKAMTAAVATSGTGETILFQATIPASLVIAGDSFRIRLAGISSSTGTLLFKVRVGPAGTVADPVAWTLTTSAAQVANAHAGIEGILNIRTVGAPGSAVIDGHAHAGALSLATLIGAVVVVTPTTTSTWYITVTCACSVGTFTAQVGEVKL